MDRVRRDRVRRLAQIDAGRQLVRRHAHHAIRVARADKPSYPDLELAHGQRDGERMTEIAVLVLPLRGRGVALSGRVSLELVAKAARAGIELMAAVSAPSSLAIEAAQACRITLCAFVREDRATVYTHPHRLGDLSEQGGAGR